MDEISEIDHHAKCRLAHQIAELTAVIIGNGTMVVETPNEAVLVKLLELYGLKIPIERCFRNIEADYGRHVKDMNNGTKT